MEGRTEMINQEIGGWPASISVVSTGAERFVRIDSDHNTDDYDTELDEVQVRALRDALSVWLNEGGATTDGD